MTSYYCQICRMDMSIARIRTPDDPPDAAWDHKGCNYVGFTRFRDFNGDLFPDQQCQQCTTADRTPANFYDDARNAAFVSPLSADEDDKDDEWLPDDDSDANSEPLEYDTEAGSDAESSEISEDEDRSADDESNDANIRDALRDMYAPPQPRRLPHGTWLNGSMHTRDRGRQLLFDVLQEEAYGSYPYPAGHIAVVVPPEHIAAPSCQSVQGINGHMLSAEEMKNCRTHRFLLAKPPQWRADVSDSIFENDSSFVLSGESNGSYTSSEYPCVYPPRYDVDKVKVWTLYANHGCNDSDQWKPLPVHSYCLDMYAKASYRRLGRVDLDGIWHWREMQDMPEAYNLSRDDLLPCPEVSRGRKHHTDPWCHHPGDEWLAANPVEVPRFHGKAISCFTSIIYNSQIQPLEARFLALPAELIDCIISFLDEKDLNVVADTCRTLRYHTQSFFKALVSKDLGWLWEIFEGARYPSSPDRPSTWDPCFPPGFIVPDLPIGLQTEEDENTLWKEIVNDDPDMHSVGETIKTLNFLRREAILDPSRAVAEWSLREWQGFRTEVADWIRRLPSSGTERTEGLDWVHLWRLFNPNTTPIRGIRNRARIWTDCERIIDYNNRLRKQSGMNAKQANVLEVISYNRVQWWEEARIVMRNPYPS